MGRLRIAARAVAALLLALFGGTGCSPRPDDPVHANVVRAVIPTDPQSLTLIGGTDRYSQVVGRLVSDGLVAYDPDLVVRPRLARSWETSEDGKEVTFRLRDGVRWQDGAPLTARDVVFTVERIRDPRSLARSWAPAFEDLERVEAPDDLTVRATYREPFADVLDAWRFPVLPRHLVGADADLSTDPFAKHPIGCGPFRFVRFIPGREIVLEANPDYWDGRPGVDGLVLRVIGNDRTAFEALLRGDVDILGVPPDLYREALGSTRAANLGTFSYYRLMVWYASWNLDGSNPFFVDPRVRRAMVLALDRERFVSRVLGGLARPAVGTYLPELPWSDPAAVPIPFDPAEAGRLLEAAGWIDRDADGVRDRDGRPFAFTLIYPAGMLEVTDRMAAWMQQSWASVGVRASLERVEAKAFYQRRREHRFEAQMASWSFTPVADQFEIYHSSARDGGLNYGGFADPEVDRLIEAGRRTLDPAARLRIYRDLQRRLRELEPVSCLFQFAQSYLYDLRLRGVTRSAVGLWDIDPGPRGWRWTASPDGGP